MTVIKANVSDLSAIMALEARVYGQDPDFFSDPSLWKAWLQSGQVFKSVADGKLVGAAAVLPEREARRVETLFVDPAYRGQGLGREMLITIMGAFADAALSLDVKRRNYSAIALYTDCGFMDTTLSQGPAYSDGYSHMTRTVSPR